MTLQLATADAAVTLLPERGADLIEFIDRRTGIDVLYRTPWADRARSVASHGSRLSLTGAAAWLEGYHGGCQVMCPEPGRSVDLAEYDGFQGESSAVAWQVDAATDDTASLHVELFTAPLRIDREVRLTGTSLRIADTVRNLAPVPTAYHFHHHPAFGAPLVGAGTRLEVAARTVTVPPGNVETPLPDGVPLPWPPELPGYGRGLDRGPAERPWSMLGWLAGIDRPVARVVNPDLDLAVRMEWDLERQPYLWLWEEFGLATDFPFFGRGRVIALEPSTTLPSATGVSPTEGRRVLTPGGSEEFVLDLTTESASSR